MAAGTSLTHVAMHVANIEDCVAFYQHYCGVTDPSGNYVEFSYGQPLGPGAEDDNPIPKTL